MEDCKEDENLQKADMGSDEFCRAQRGRPTGTDGESLDLRHKPHPVARTSHQHCDEEVCELDVLLKPGSDDSMKVLQAHKCGPDELHNSASGDPLKAPQVLNSPVCREDEFKYGTLKGKYEKSGGWSV